MNSDDPTSASLPSPENASRETGTDSAQGRREIFRQTAFLSGSSVLAQAMRFVKNFILAGMLGPSSFGLWNGLQVFLIYGTNTHLGTLHSMSREIPLRRGSGEKDQIPALASAGFTVTLLASLVGGIIITLASWWLTMGETDFIPALLLFPVLVSQQLYVFYQFLLRAEDEFVALSNILSLASILELVASVGIVFLVGFNGVFFGLIFSQSIGIIAALVYKRRLPLKLTIDRAIIRNLVVTGFPIMLTVLGYFVLTTIDRLMIIRIAGSESLGYYALGSLAITALSYVPLAVNQVMYPKFAERFGITGDPQALSGYIRVPTLITAHAMGFVAGAAIIGLPLVSLLLPKYTPGIPAAQILIAGFYFLALPGSAANFLITINRQGQYLIFLIGAIVLAGISDFSALNLGWGIEGVALVTAIVYAMYALMFIRFTIARHMRVDRKPFGLMLGKLLLPAAICAALFFCVSLITPGGMITNVALQMILFSAFYGPLSFWILRLEKVR